MNIACLFFTLVTFVKTPEETPMKLVHKISGTTLIEFSQGTPTFHDRLLKMEMEEAGILIPPFLRKSFAGEKKIFPGDPLFEKAFHEVYCVFTLPKNMFEWQ